MSERFFLAASGTAGDAAGSRVLWTGRCGVAEYAFEEPSSLPRWTLPEETEVAVTEDKVVYRDPSTGATGELLWLFPQHLRVQPGNRDTGRSATVTQIQLVCSGPGGSFPALVFAGGDLATVGDADRLANVLRQAIARYRVEHAAELGIAAPQARMLSRLVIGPEFNNYQGGEGQTVSLLGSASVIEPQPPIAYEPFLDPYLPGTPASGSVPASAVSGYAPREEIPAYGPYGSREDAPGYAPHPYASGPVEISSVAPVDLSSAATVDFSPAASASWPLAGRADLGVTPPQVRRPGFDEAARSRPGRPADEATLRGAPDLEARAADLAARVASLVAGGTGFDRRQTEMTNLSSLLGSPDESADRAEQVRRTAARMAGNAPRGRGVAPRRPIDDEMGQATRNL
ncbi:translation initiation factor 2 [Paractinoplanes globisporus]|uniref:Translation initiation factor 2 n=1 Tax=Paractinoplanes globisporus TaxID=113565 RepID=A0ABW6WMD3_9ACTN|nr:translation initiation factor 2 [Actinoplanes globisporus]